MKAKISSIFWGIVLIVVAGLLLAERLGYIDFEKISTNAWVYIFVGGGLLFLLGYFLSGLKQWGLLFPALILAAIGGTIWMGDHQLEGAYMGAPILASIAIPFYAGFLVNRKNWGLLIPAWIMTVLTAITLLVDRAAGTWVGSLFLFAAALPFLIVYLRNRKRWWALIPTWVLFVLGVITFFSESGDGNLISAFFLYSVALPFLVVYLTDRKRRWALIPAAILGVLGTIPLLASLIGGDVMGAAVMFLFAIPFFVAYFRSRDNWWALIPAGIFASIGLVVVLGMVLPANASFTESITTGILFLGFGLTFGLLWLRRTTVPTDWAKYPAIGLFTAALLAFVLGKQFQNYWAIILLVAGILMVVAGLLPKKQKEEKPQA